MKRVIVLLLLAATLNITAQISHDFHKTPLLEALQTISQEQTEYVIDILADGLEDLTTSTVVKDRPVPDAIRQVCKKLPVKVKTKGSIITVQATQKQLQRPDHIELVGEIEDGFLEMPLPEACVSMHSADSTLLKDSLPIIRFIGGYNRLLKAQFYANVKPERREYLFHARMEGYDDVWQRVSITNPTKKEVTVPTLQMFRMRNVNLDEVTITATKIKFFYRGDTLIYDATAFRMPEGSMLDDLIRQLQGVTMNDNGEIFVNGRKVDELLLGSHTFFGGNRQVLMKNLPYYTVKHIKVYEKQTDMSEALGYDVEPRRYVMDVNLKEEYSRGYIANVEAAAGTENRWLGRAFALRFTDWTRITLFANANNVNETLNMGQTGHWTPSTMPQSQITTHSVAAEIVNYPKGDKLRNELYAQYTRTDDEMSMYQRRENFLTGRTTTSLAESLNERGDRRLNVRDALTIKKPMWIYATANIDYSQRNGLFRSYSEQWDDTLTTSMHCVGMTSGRTWKWQADVQGAFNIGEKGRMTFYTMGSHNEEASEEATRYEQPPTTLTTADGRRHNTNDISNRYNSAMANLQYIHKVAEKLSLSVSDGINYHTVQRHDYLYHPDTLLLPSQIDALKAITDFGNSYDSQFSYTDNGVGLTLFKDGTYRLGKEAPSAYTISYQKFSIALSLPVRHETLHYRRGTIDTLAVQNTVFLNPSFSFRHVSTDGRHDIRFNTNHKREGSNLSDRITYRDDSQPLVVKLGNPDLQGRVTTSLSTDYYNGRSGNYQQQFHLGASFNYQHRDVAQAVAYNPANGVFTYQPKNISGAFKTGTTFDYSRAFGEKRYWTVQTKASTELHHSKDHAMLAGETASHVNTVNTLTLHDGGYVQYERGAFNIRASGDISWRHSEGLMYDFTTLNALDFHYGLSGRYTLPKIKTTLSADGTMYSRRGYGSAELNTNDFILNASLSQPFLKGKLIARVEAFDLLQQLNATQYYVDAQGRIETHYRSLPHYIMFHLVWHWNKNPKQKL